ncbi:metallophosphoesterase family protein [Paenibacillus thermoaerophilus]|uniref:Metallophosphoesterase family protein n=1 Tax=Paenibacillus thermoaerophilus TaxID=1215385 RepID=A0ABW2V3W5_9BACL|nr:metallophosphoesterase [Paenibacillus thermoaerophilus]TMV18255.1 metallophosphoesterase [Paenibacillus thermoaerophilus]
MLRNRPDRWSGLLLFAAAALAAAVNLSASVPPLAAPAPAEAVPPAGPASAADTPLLTFAVLSDLHVSARHPESQRLFRQALLDYRSVKPDLDLLVLNGDLTEGAPEDYRALRRILGEVPHAPVHAVMGNHDFYGMWRQRDGHYDYGGRLSPDWSSGKAVSLFQRSFGYGAPYHHVWLRDRLFVFLSGERYRDEDGTVGEDAYLSERQMIWLKHRLHEHSHRPGPKPRPVFAFIHQPLPGTVGGSSERGIVQHTELRNLLSRFPELILFTGHTHRLAGGDQYVQGPFAMIGCSSVRRVNGADDKPVAEARSESLYAEVYADRTVLTAREHVSGTWIGSPRVIRP